LKVTICENAEKWKQKQKQKHLPVFAVTQAHLLFTPAASVWEANPPSLSSMETAL
jgi:hypothetical protein